MQCLGCLLCRRHRRDERAWFDPRKTVPDPLERCDRVRRTDLDGGDVRAEPTNTQCVRHNALLASAGVGTRTSRC